MKEEFKPQVLIDRNARPIIVFRKARKYFHAVAAEHDSITLVELESLRGYRPLAAFSHPDGYPPRKAASFWLNHDHRPITKRAKAVLQGLVSRKPKGGQP